MYEQAAAGDDEDALARLGRVVRTEDGRVRGVIGAGHLNLNPAVIDVDVRADGALRIAATAKEGLIPQRTAQKAVRRVIEAVYSVAPPS